MIALANHRHETTAGNQGQRTIAELTKTVSASRLSTWLRCRLQLYFRYVAGIQKSPTPALHVGTTVHTVLQQWNLGRWRGRELEVQELKEIFSRAWVIWQDGEQIDWEGKEEAVKSTTWDLLQLYLRETPIAPNEKPEAVEVGVEADLSGHGLPLLVGVIDLVRAGRRIVDFKTAARKPDAELLAHTAETQTTSYGLLYREATGSRKTGSRFIT
jgi:putative RecB family exonuclease